MNSETTPSVQTPAGIAVQGLAGFVMTLAIVAAPRTRTDRIGLGFYFRPILPTLCGFLQEMQTFPRRNEKKCAQVAIAVEVSQEEIKAAARVADFPATAKLASPIAQKGPWQREAGFCQGQGKCKPNSSKGAPPDSAAQPA
ncbi:MAG: hypothetical protein WA579_18755 [Rhodomicrobium sp.]